MDEKPIYSNGRRWQRLHLKHNADFVVLCLLLKLSTESLFVSCNGNLLRLGCRAPHQNPAISIFLLVMLFKAPCSGNNGLLPCQQEPCHMLFSLHTFFSLNQHQVPLEHLLPALANCAKLLGQNHFAEQNWHILTFSS